MSQFSEPLSASAQSAYADLLGVVRDEELTRSIENLVGSFSKKESRGATYWYFQVGDVSAPRQVQIFVGPDTPEVRALVERARAKPRDGQIGALVKAAAALGCETSTNVHFRIVRRLNEIGFFRAGGLLIGTHAFLTYGNLLGAKFGVAGQTQDVDFAHAGAEVQLALPATLEIKVRTAIEALGDGFLPVMRSGAWDDDPKPTATFANRRDKALKIDFLTPKTPGSRGDAFRHAQLGVPLQPLDFLEFILEDVTQTALLGPSGAVLVSVPSPARYALHKLIVHAERKNREKARKDLTQAAALLEIIEPGDEVRRLWKNMLARGKAWRAAAIQGRNALAKLAPDLDMLKAMKG